MEETLVLIKPDGVKRQICGEILTRYERKGLIIKAMKLLQTSKELAEEHYAEHKDKPFFGELVDFITSGPRTSRQKCRYFCPNYQWCNKSRRCHTR